MKPAAKAKLAPKAKPAAKTVTKKAPAKKKPAKPKAGSVKAATKPNLTPKSFQEAADIFDGKHNIVTCRGANFNLFTYLINGSIWVMLNFKLAS